MGTGASASAKICMEWRKAFTSMKISNSEVERLNEVFNRVDVDGSGSVDAAELLVFLDIAKTNLTRRLFTNFDRDFDGQINFYEFVLSLWRFLTIKQKSLYGYVFDLFDLDGDGELSTNEMMLLMRALNERFADTNAVTKWIESAADDDKINILVFGNFCSSHQTLLHSVYDLHTRLKDKVLGAGFWEAIAGREISINRSLAVNVAQLLEMHSDRTAFAGLLNGGEVTSNADTRELLQSIHSAKNSKGPSVATKASPQHKQRAAKTQQEVSKESERVPRKKADQSKQRKTPGLFQPARNRIGAA